MTATIITQSTPSKKPAASNGKALPIFLGFEGRKLPDSALELIKCIDGWPYFLEDPVAYRRKMEDFYYFMIDGFKKPFGYLHESFVHAMPWPSVWQLDEGKKTVTLMAEHTFEARTAALAETVAKGFKLDTVFGLRKWKEEYAAVLAPDQTLVANLDNCVSDTFGIVACGVHMIAHTDTPQGRRYWVPRRATTKAVYPGRLDNTIAGNLQSGESPLEAIVRECAEEASIPEDFTRQNIKACGTVTYMMTATHSGRPGCQHHCQYVYELEIPDGMKLVPFDGEAQYFSLMNLEDILVALFQGQFMPLCVMTWMAYLTRNGIINADNDKDVAEICARLHRKLDIFIV